MKLPAERGRSALLSAVPGVHVLSGVAEPQPEGPARRERSEALTPPDAILRRDA